MANGPTMYERVGGREFFTRLVDAFYEGVAADEVLAPLYPEHPDFTGARHRLTMFLVQYWGGPTDYDAERGQPRLRMRHLRFPIGTTERDRWLGHMTNAVEAATQTLAQRGEIASELLDYFRSTAEHLRNDTGLPITSVSFRNAE
jgi:hemoglobin